METARSQQYCSWGLQDGAYSSPKDVGARVIAEHIPHALGLGDPSPHCLFSFLSIISCLQPILQEELIFLLICTKLIFTIQPVS